MSDAKPTIIDLYIKKQHVFSCRIPINSVVDYRFKINNKSCYIFDFGLLVLKTCA